MTAYYNEIDPYAAQWLHNLMVAGHIAPGIIDTRSIEDVIPSELAGFTQCHFFAGIGGWSLALRIAGWPDDQPVWTGSCPCQPFSAAGKGAGFADERHLWPAWQHLIAQCLPPVVFGEQVASKAVEPWIDLVHADLEGMGYAFGCVPFPSAGVGAPHIRDRIYWVADAEGYGYKRAGKFDEQAGRHGAAYSSPDGRLADANGSRHLPGALAGVHRIEGCAGSRHGELERPRAIGGMADAYSGKRDGIAVVRGNERNGTDAGRAESIGGAATCGEVGGPGPTNGFWRAADWLGCTDGKWRPVEPGTFPLAHGIPNRVGRLRAYGNAINPHQAAEFILAYAETRNLMLP